MNKFGLLSTFILLLSLLWLFSGNVKAEQSETVLSPALDVIASRLTMIKSTEGSDVDFAPEDFDIAVGVDRVSAITVTSLPSESKGVLYLGAMEVSEGQRIDRDSISEMTFRCNNGVEKAEVCFTYDGGDYDFTCVIRTVDETNYAPTSIGVDGSFYSIQTYKNIAVFGNMRVNDPDGDTVTFDITEYPSKGLLVLSDRANGDYTYTPIKNYSGKDSFSYVAIDEYGNRSAEMTVNITVCQSKSGTVYGDMIGHPCHYGAILMSDMEIMEGTEDSTGKVFMPEKKVTSYELISCLLRVMELSCGEETRAEQVQTAISLGLIEDEYDLDGYITRAEACMLIDKLVEGEAWASGRVINDALEIPSEASKSVYTMAELNVITVEGGNVSPNGLLNRGEMARMLSALLEI